MMNPRWRRQPGKKLGSSVTKSRFLDILDGLIAANAIQLDFLKLGHFCVGFDRSRKFACIIGLFKSVKTLRITIDRIYLGKDVYY